MKIKEIYEAFEKVHSYSFATVNNDFPEIRIAHFLTYDEEGIYFQTMNTKSFYEQLIKNKKVAVCSLVSENIPVEHDEEGLSNFPLGFFIRVNGYVKEIPFEVLKEKASKDIRFNALIKDIERYPSMTTFILYKFKGEVFNYDFAKEKLDYKIKRERFSIGGMEYKEAGLIIDAEKCISCGKCLEICSFDAIVHEDKYFINSKYCDECGSCKISCPVDAIKKSL
ncbi:MAG: 4Fe-4S binding protein [Fusobacterium sp. JB021]|nr:4Fe-4S binding protein [Fusobacterium sp. JB021]MDP0506132.1 4Fe-4S binding protein [Fusobacterium sp. JB019]